MCVTMETLDFQCEITNTPNNNSKYEYFCFVFLLLSLCLCCSLHFGYNKIGQHPNAQFIYYFLLYYCNIVCELTIVLLFAIEQYEFTEE